MKTAIFPASFKPWHKGHEHILTESLKVFDKVILLQAINKDKALVEYPFPAYLQETYGERIAMSFHNGLLQRYLLEFPMDAIVKGIRNAQDLEYETSQLYWNEDLGIKIPTFFVITDRNYRHISSSAIRMVGSFTNE